MRGRAKPALTKYLKPRDPGSLWPSERLSKTGLVCLVTIPRNRIALRKEFLFENEMQSTSIDCFFAVAVSFPFLTIAREKLSKKENSQTEWLENRPINDDASSEKLKIQNVYCSQFAFIVDYSVSNGKRGATAKRQAQLRGQKKGERTRSFKAFGEKLFLITNH